MVRYASIFAKKYGTLVRYAFFVMVRVQYVGTVRFKNQLKYSTVVRRLDFELELNQDYRLPYLMLGHSIV